MLETVLMVLAVFLMVFGISLFVIMITEAIVERKQSSFIVEALMIAIGLSYLIWYCN